MGIQDMKQKVKENNLIAELSENRETCCGCAACAAVCPTTAIKMEYDKEGFLYPAIEETKCVKCYQCISICAFKKSKNENARNTDVEAYAARIKDKEILANSSSGGMFTVFSNYALCEGAALVCSIYDYQNYCVNYQLIDNETDRNKAYGSKYLQSEMGEIYKKCYEWLERNPHKKLYFFGMGCQAAAFLNVMKKWGCLERIVVIDIICHGVPSPRVWKEYITEIEKNARKKMEYFTFKDKRNGWNHPTAVAEIDGKEESLQTYINLFYQHDILRPACYTCPYATPFRSSDITIGDFWGIENTLPEFYDPMGNSLVFLHSPKGKKLFENVKSTIDYAKTNVKECLQPNLIKPTKKNKTRDKFWEEYYQFGINHIIKKYGTVSWHTKIKKWLKKIFKL